MAVVKDDNGHVLRGQTLEAAAAGQFRGLFSDAAGTFVAEWKIVNGSAARTVLTNSDDVVGVIMAGLDQSNSD